MRKVAILGTAGTLLSLPTPGEAEWWGVGPAVFAGADAIADKRGGKRPSRHLSRWYDIHSAYHFEEQGPEYWRWLSELQCPVFMQKVEPEIPNSVAFPADKLRQMFGPHFGGSVSWMLAHAMLEHCAGHKIEKISLHGVHLSHKEEYEDEARGACFLMGWASGLGIQIECFDILLPIRNYGYDR